MRIEQFDKLLSLFNTDLSTGCLRITSGPTSRIRAWIARYAWV
ncbi:hypothetical protein [uncultured Gimesia sp.]